MGNTPKTVQVVRRAGGLEQQEMMTMSVRQTQRPAEPKPGSTFAAADALFPGLKPYRPKLEGKDLILD